MCAGDNIGASLGRRCFGRNALRRGRETRVIRGHLRSAGSVFEMMTLQGNPPVSRKGETGAATVKGCRVNVRRVCAAPTRLEW